MGKVSDLERGDLVRPQSDERSVIPYGRYETEGVASDGHVTDGRERQVSGHQLLAGRRELPYEPDPDAG